MDNELGTLVDLTWKLLLVLALAVLATRALRRLSLPASTPETLLRVVARLPVGPQQSLLLIAVGRKKLLLGQCSQQLTLLGELGEEDLAVPVRALRDPPNQVSGQATLVERVCARVENLRLQHKLPSSTLPRASSSTMTQPLHLEITGEGSSGAGESTR